MDATGPGGRPGVIEADFIDWDDPDDPEGNVAHLAENDVTPAEFEEVLSRPEGRDDVSRTTGRPVRFGWTSTGKHLIIVFEIADDGGFVIVRPITAYEVDPRNE